MRFQEGGSCTLHTKSKLWLVGFKQIFLNVMVEKLLPYLNSVSIRCLPQSIQISSPFLPPRVPYLNDTNIQRTV